MAESRPIVTMVAWRRSPPPPAVEWLSGSVRARRRAAVAPSEDAVCCGPTWFAVADGIGGQRAGDVASRVAVERLLRDQPSPR